MLNAGGENLLSFKMKLQTYGVTGEIFAQDFFMKNLFPVRESGK